jgi:hypothetical protein
MSAIESLTLNLKPLVLACLLAPVTSVYAANVFTAGDLVLSIYGNGDNSGSYADNQASPIVLQAVTTAGVLGNKLVLPQASFVNASGVLNSVISGEYGSSSEGSLQLSADGKSLTIMGYGVNAATFNSAPTSVYGTAALAQTTSLQGGSVTPVSRVVANVRADGTVDTSTAVYGIFNTNNPRSAATVDGTSFYLSGQGVSGGTTQGVFLAQDGASTATAINTKTDTRTVEIINGQLYVSTDSKQPKSAGGSANIAVYGASLPTGPTTPTLLPGISNSITIAASQNGINAAGKVFLSPENFFLADASTLYIADGGQPKEGGLGDGGLQKWSFDGSVWKLDYTLSAGLGLVANTATAGTTGLIGLTGKVSGNMVELYATNSTLGDLDPTYLFGITDSLNATSLPTGESFTKLLTAAADTNIRGVAFAPTAAVPEADTYAMMLAGLGLVGAMARRRARVNG